MMPKDLNQSTDNELELSYKKQSNHKMGDSLLENDVIGQDAEKA